MTVEEIKALDITAVVDRCNEVRKLIEDGSPDIDALTIEVDALIARKAEIEANNAKFAELRSKMANSNPVVIEDVKTKQEDNGMTIKEVRSMPAYVDAFAEYIRSNDDKECRKIITEKAGSSVEGARVPVPTFVDDVIKSAFSAHKILDLVTKTNLKGVVRVGVEVDASAAEVHAEGTDAINEEELTLRIVEMVPATVKKWVSMSDEVSDMDNGAFVQYIYNEIANKIFSKIEDIVVEDIRRAAGGGLVGITSAHFTAIDFIAAVSALSDAATNPVIIMNKASYAFYKQVAMNLNYGADIFDGMTVLFNNTLVPVTSSEVSGDVAIVGDLSGYQLNYPNGYDVQFKYDDNTYATSDMVRIIGRLPVGHAVVSKMFFTVLKAVD